MRKTKSAKVLTSRPVMNELEENIMGKTRQKSLKRNRNMEQTQKKSKENTHYGTYRILN